MKKAFKKAISILLAAVMVFGAAPLAGFVGLELPEINLFSTKAEAAKSGSCGENLKWTLNETTGALNISGLGEMNSYSYSSKAPWYSYKSKIKNVLIGIGVTNIGNYAFYDCDKITSVTIRNTVTSIGNDAFSGCTSLANVTIPDSVTDIGEGAFYGCSGLAEITIGKGVTSIGIFAFAYCESLTSVTIPDSVTSIGYMAFGECTNLTKVTIGNGITSMDNEEFALCSGITELTMPVSAEISSYAFLDSTNIKKITLTKGTGKMADYSEYYSDTVWYQNRNNCLEIILEDGIENICTNAFAGCTGLTRITIPDSVTDIGQSAFSGCSGLTKVIIGNGVTNIGLWAFSDCTGIKELTMPVSAQIYGSEDTFGNCTNIEKITLTKGTGIMQTYTDYYYTYHNPDSNYYQITPWYISRMNYPEIILEDGVKHIGKYAFCFNRFKSITIPDSVTSIGWSAFENCTVRDVYFTGSKEEWDSISISENNEELTSATVHFPTVESISILTSPSKTSYFAGESFDTNGLTLTAKFSNGKTKTITKGFTFTPEVFEKVGTQSIIVCYEGKSIEIPVLVEEIKYYTVKFVADGITVSETSYKQGEAIAVPAVSPKYGYAFNGWTPYVPDFMPAEDLVFTATWNANSYNAIFDANGGAWSDGATSKAVPTKFDDEIAAPESPTKQGYVFVKWSPEVGIMDSVDGKMFVAEWIAAIDTRYTVETYVMNTLGEYEKTTRTFSGATDSTVSAEYEIGAGFTLNTEKSIVSGTVAVDNSLVLKVYIDRNTYAFTTIVDGVSTETNYFYGSIISEPATPSKAEYKFIKWDTAIPETMPAENVTVIAVFEKAYICPECGNEILGEDAINEHIVSETKVTISDGVVVKSGDLKPNATITVSAPQVDGKIFRYWSVDGAKAENKNSAETKIVLGSGKITITAEYDDCDCKCHQGGIVGFFFKIVLFFQKLFGKNLECFCGQKH